MTNFISSLLILSFITGQLVRIPFAKFGAITVLDIFSISLILFGLIKSKFKLPNPPLFLKLGFLFAFWGFVSLIFTPLNLTYPEFLISFSYIIRLCIYLSLGIIFLSQPFKNLREKIIPILLCSGVIVSMIGLLQFLIFPDLQFLTINGWDPHYFRTVSTFLDPNFAGAFFVLTLLLLISYPRGRNTMTPRVSYIFFALVYLALLTTFSRSSYLMFLTSGVILSLLKRSGKIFISTIILFIILLLGFYMYSQLVAQPRGIDREQSASFRVNTWEQGLTIFQKSPFFGIGFNAYRYGLREYNLGNEQFLKSHGSSSNDSSLLFVLSATGIIGLIIYSGFLISLVKYSSGSNILLTPAIGGLLIHSIFANSLFYPPIFIWLILIAVSKDNYHKE